MLKQLFSPVGKASRLGFFLTVIFSAAVEFVLGVALESSRQDFAPDVFYLIMAAATAPFAWLQVCAAVRRFQDLNWHWAYALPLSPLCLWSLWALLDIEFSPVAALVLTLFALYAAILFILLSTYRGSEAARMLAPAVSEAPAARTSPSLQQAEPVSVAGTTCPNGHFYVPDAGSGCPFCAAKAATPPPGEDRNQLVGWLVIIEGPGRGAEFRLCSRPNRIGNDASMEVCLMDPGVSATDHASVVYDPASLTHTLRPGASPVTVNGTLVRGYTQLRLYDRLKLGSTIMIFVPFAGVYHVWGEAVYASKGSP